MSSTSSTISSGVGSQSGINFDWVVEQSVKLKRQQLSKPLQKEKALAEDEQQGLDLLKQALTGLKNSCDELTKDNSMNTHKVTTTQSSTYQAFTLKTKPDCTNSNFDIAVTQLAKAESIHQDFKTDQGFKNSFQKGTIEVNLGTETYKDKDGLQKTRERKFSVEVQEGDTIELVRKRLNQNDFGLNVGLIKTDSGYSLSIYSGSTGKNTSQLSVKVTPAGNVDANHDDLTKLAFDEASQTKVDSNTGERTLIPTSGSNWTFTDGKDAEILVDGQKVSSHSNKFDEQIAGLTLEVTKLSEKETDANGNSGFKTYNVNVTTDADAAKAKMQGFVENYNTLVQKLNELYKHDTYDNKTGERNRDGGMLSGDSQVKSIENTLSSMLVNFKNKDAGKSIFDCGIEYNRDGTLKLDSTKFENAIKNNFNSVVDLFSGENSVSKEMSKYIKEYTQTGGMLDNRITENNKHLKNISIKESDNLEKITKYESFLKLKYSKLDSLLSGYQKSLNNLLNSLSR